MRYDEKIAVTLARAVYGGDDSPPLPEGVNQYWPCPEEYQKNGYYGSSYSIDTEFGPYIIIAHRGTANFNGVIEDAEMKFFDKIPSQFYDGAIPFINFVLDKVQKDYPDRTVPGAFTGHSLGATLSELSIVHYANDKNRPIDFTWDFTYVFDSPGSKDLVDQQLANKEITEQDVQNAGYCIVVINSEVNAVNTCMKTSSRDSTYIRSYLGVTPYSSLSNGDKLPYDPNVFYYFLTYTVADQYPIKHMYNCIIQDESWYAIDISFWPIEVNAAYYAYKTYYGCNPPDNGEYGLVRHNIYWDQYTNVYWDQNPQIHSDYDDDKWTFKDFYYKNVCYYVSGYELSKELDYRIDAVDMKKIMLFLSIPKESMHPTNANKKGTENLKIRTCCGVDFFQAAKRAQQGALNAVETAGKVITETGEELTRIIPSTFQKESENVGVSFFRYANKLFVAEEAIGLKIGYHK